MSFLYFLLICLLPIYANVCNNLIFVMETQDTAMESVIESICKMYYDEVDLDMKIIPPIITIANLEDIFKEAKEAGKNVLVGKLPSLNKVEINELAIKYNIIFWDATLKTDNTCLTNVVEGFGGCTAIAFGLSVIHYSYTKSIIVSDSTSPIADCSEMIYNYLLYEGYPGPELKKITTQAEIDGIVNDYRDESDTIILNFLTGGGTGSSTSNSKYLYEKRKAEGGAFNIISFHNVNGEELLGYDNPKDTLILSEALLKINVGGDLKYLDIDQFIMVQYMLLLVDIGKNTGEKDLSKIHRLVAGTKYELNGEYILLLPSLSLSGDVYYSKVVENDANPGSYLLQEISFFPRSTEVAYVDIYSNPFDKICDITIDSEGEFKPTNYYIILLTYISGQYLPYDRPIRNCMEAAVTLLNNELSVLGEKIYGIPIDANDSPQNISDQIMDKFEKFNVIGIFTTQEFSDFEEFLKTANSTIFDVNIYYLNIVPNEICSSKCYFGGLNVGNMWRETKSYFNPTNIVLIGNKGTLFENAVVYIEDDCNLNDINIRGKYTMDSLTSQHALNACNEIESGCKNYDDCLVIIITERQYLQLFYEEYYTRNFPYKILNFNLDETMIAVNKTLFEGSYVIGFYFDSMEGENNYDDELRDYFNSPTTTVRNSIITSNAAIGYTQIRLFALAINIARKTDRTSIENTMQYTTYYGPGGLIYGSLQGYNSFSAHTGIVKDGNISRIHTAYYVERTNAFGLYNISCNWITEMQSVKESKYVVFLYVRSHYTEADINNYILTGQYAIEYINNQHDGVAGYKLRAITPYLTSVEEMVQYVRSTMNDKDVLVYVGTLSVEERDAISSLLEESKKLLFSIHPAEGNQCYKNFGRLPQHYTFSVLAYDYKFLKKCVIIYDDLHYSEHLANFTLEYAKPIRTMECSGIQIHPTTNLTELVNNTIYEEYPDGVIILTVVDHKTEDLLYELRDADKSKYMITILDHLEYKYLNSERKEVYEGVYYVTSYTYKTQYETSKVMLSITESFYGKPENLMTDSAITLYSALRLLDLSYNSEDADQMRYNMYETTVDTPIGDIVMTSSNMLKIYFFLMKIENNEQNIILESEYSYEENQYSSILNGKNMKCHFEEGSKDILQDEEVYEIGVWLEEDESVRFSLQEYYYNVNSNGGNAGVSFVLTSFYCNETEQLVKYLKKGDVEYILSLCDNELHISLADDISENNVTVFALQDQYEFMCEPNIITIGSSPSQRIIPLIEYLFTHHETSVYVIMPSQYDHSIELNLLISTIEVHGGNLIKTLFIDENNSTQYEENVRKVGDFVSSVHRYTPDGGIILNYLYILTEEVYKAMNLILQLHNVPPHEMSLQFPIVAMEYDSLSTINVTYMDSQFALAINHLSRDISPYLYSLSETTYGLNNDLSVLEGRALITSEIIYTVIIGLQKSQYNDLSSFVHKTVFSTSFGEIHITEDNYLPAIVSLYQADSEKKTAKRIVLSQEWPGEIYRESFQNVTLFDSCNVTKALLEPNRRGRRREGINPARVSRMSLNIVLFVPLSGLLKIPGYDMLLGYLAVIDYFNKEIPDSGRYLNPIVIDTKLSYETPLEEIPKMRGKYHTLLAFGMDRSENRIKVIDALEENNVILFYPRDFEGYECKENIIYTGVPFSAKLPYLSWILGNLGTNIYIIYTDKYNNRIVQEMIEHDMYLRGYSIAGFTRVPQLNYMLDQAISQIRQTLKTGGVVISYLEGSAALEFFKLMYENGLTSDIYHIVADNLDLSNLNSEYAKYMENHYIWNTFSRDEYNLEAYTKLFNQKFTYISSESQGYVPSALSIVILAEAMVKPKYNFSNDIPYTFSDMLNAIHSVNTSEIKVYTDNYISFSLVMHRIVKNKEGKFVGDIIYTYKSFGTPNPWSSTYNMNGKYICDWSINNPDRNETIQVEAINIAIIFPLTSMVLGDFSTSMLETTIGTLLKINDEGGVNGLIIDYDVYDTGKETQTELDSVANKILMNRNIVAAFGCLSEECKDTISNKLKDNSIALFYPGLAYGQECNKYVYYTSAVTNQYLDPLITYLTTYQSDKKVLLIGDTSRGAGYITEILVSLFKNIMTIADTILLDPVDEAIQAKITPTINSLPEGAIIISYVQVTNFVSIVNTLESTIYSSGLFSIYAIGIHRDALQSITTSTLVDIYFIFTYFSELKEHDPYKDSLMTYTGRADTYTTGNSLYISLYLWKAGVERANSFKTDLVRPSLYNVKIEGGAGYVELLPNHYLTNPFFIAKATVSTKSFSLVYSQTIVILPMPYNWNINTTYGKTCNFLEEEPEKISIPLTVVVAISVTGYNNEMESGIYNIINMCITDLNNDHNGLLNTQLYLEKADIGSDDNVCIDTLRSLFKTTSASIIFTSASEYCLNVLMNDASEADIPIFHIGYTPGESCHYEVVYGNKDPSVIERIIDVNFQAFEDKTYYYSIVGSTDPASTNCVEYAAKYIEYKGATVYVTSTLNPDTVTIQNIDSVVKNIQGQAPQGCYILFFGTPKLHYMLDESLKKFSMDYEMYPILSYTTGEIMNNYENISPFISAQSFFAESHLSKTNTELFNHIREYTAVPLTEYIINSYVLFQMWVRVVEQDNALKWSKIRTKMYDAVYDAPEGPINIHSNNYLDHRMEIGLYNTTTKMFDIYYSSSSPISPTPWKRFINEGRFICDFSTSTAGARKKQSTITIGLLASYSGDNSIMERSIAEGVFYAVNLINKEGGLLGNQLIVEIRDPESKNELYLEYAKELSQLEEVKAVFGGGRYSVQQLVAPILDTYKFPYFYPGISGGEICYRHLFSTQSTVSQISTVLLKYVYPQFENMIIVTQNTSFAQLLEKSVHSMAEIVHTTIFGPYLYPDLDELYTLEPSFIESAAIILLANAEDYSSIINALCDNNIVASKDNIYAITADGNRLATVRPECIRGIKIITTFLKEIGEDRMETGYMESAASFVTDIKDNYGNSVVITSAMEAAYSAVQVYADAVKSSYTDDPELVTKLLWGYSMNTPTGTMNINYNGYASRVFFLCETITATDFKIIQYSSQPEYPDAYNQYIKENYGVVCDWTDGGDKYQLRSLKVAFVHEYNVTASSMEVQIMIQEFNRIRDINNNKLNGYFLVPLMYFCSTEEDYKLMLDELENEEDLSVIIGCRSAGCRDKVAERVSSMDVLFLYTGISVGQKCSKYLATFGTTASQKSIPIIEYLTQQNFDYFIYISTDEALYNTYYDLLLYDVQKYSNVTKMPRVTIPSRGLTINDYKTAIASIERHSAENRVAAFYYINGAIGKALLDEMVNEGINFRHVVLVLMRYAQSDFEDGYLKNLSGALRPASFAQDLESPLSRSFISDMREGMGYDSIITEEMEFVDTAISIWEESMEVSASDSEKDNPPIEYVRLNLISREISAPSGTVSLDNSLYSRRSIYVLEINDNGEFIQVYPQSGSTVMFDPEPFPRTGTPVECNFGLETRYFEYSSSMVGTSYGLMAIACVFSIWTLLFVFASRKKIIIRAFGRAYNFLFAIQLLILALSVIPMTIPPTESNGICKTRVVLLAICVKGVIGLMIAKTYKIYRRVRRLRQKIMRTKISFLRVILFWICFEVVEAIILILWFTVDPNEYEAVYSQKYSGYFYNMYIRECSVSTPFIVIELITDGLPVLFLIYISYKIKNSANEHNESIGLFISSIAIALLGVIMVALDFNVSNEPDSVLLIRAMGIEMTQIILILLQYGLKLVNLYINEDANRFISSGSQATNISGGGMSKLSRTQSMSQSSTFKTTHMKSMFTQSTLTQTLKTQNNPGGAKNNPK